MTQEIVPVAARNHLNFFDEERKIIKKNKKVKNSTIFFFILEVVELIKFCKIYPCVSVNITGTVN